MILELPIRWTETKEVDKDRAMIEGDSYVAEKIYTYGRLLIDTADIGPYYDIDTEHTLIKDKLGMPYTLCVPLDEFKKIMVQYTGLAIVKVHAVFLEPNKGNVKPEKPKQTEDDDDILFPQ